MSVTHHGCKLSVEGLCVVVRLVEVAISPLDEVPGLRRKAVRFSAASGRIWAGGLSEHIRRSLARE